ncbi:NAD(P) transhydrogenase subunit alpha [Actinomadura scrupuli]|uniref:NAD(P) transhydrogenase subunit alpha n=1 Tax=Actinomadura scrupuli TaxID=559629 RepID=UPI003D99DF45
MRTSTVGVVRERAPGERRVALVPDSIVRLRSMPGPAGGDGTEPAVLVESGAGKAAWFDDDSYVKAGATIVPAGELYERADIIVCVGPPDPAPLRAGQLLVGTLEPLSRPDLVRRLARQGVTAVSLDMVPRTLSRAQTMDVLSSQANIAGYKAVLLAAGAYGGYFPMLTTAAGTMRPAAVLILGTGVAGLQAIGTAHRLGAVVTAYDVRPETREEVHSLGARFLDLAAPGTASGTNGYARELTGTERRAQQQALDERVADFDVVITTARVPGRRPPVLVTAEALKGMRPGSVVLDTAAGALGGNVEGSEPDTTTVLENGVTVIGAGNLPATMPTAASTAYARNVSALLTYLMHDGAPVIDPADEIQAGVVITHGGAVVNPAVARLLDGEPRTGGPT